MNKILLIVGMLFLNGCGLLNFPLLNAPKPPDQIYNYHQTISTEPRVVTTNEKGQSVVFTAQTQTVDAGYTAITKPLSWWQRICNWMANLGILGIVVLILLLIFFPAATIAWLVAEKNKIQTAFTQTVQGIDKSNAVKTTPALAQSLSSTQDAATKAMVDDIQQPGK